MMRTEFLLFLFILAFGLLLGTPRYALADAASDIQAQINVNKQQLSALEAEIAIFQQQLNELSKKKNTLQSTISSLTLSQQQLATQIKITQNKIVSANLKIKELSLSISDKESSITVGQEAITKMLRTVAADERESLITKLISSSSLGEAWEAVDQTILFNRALANNIDRLRTIRTELATNRDQVTATKATLVALQNDLTLQKRSVDASKATQQQLLSQTKNQESNYQKLIAQKQAAEKAFEQELRDLQSRLDIIVNPNLLPKVGSGVLSWPMSTAFMNNCMQRKNVFGNLFCITQYFGNTPFSTANPQIYNNRGHNAIDFGTPIGTPIQASLSGVILATGDTDSTAGCMNGSFGKWVMIQHYNGLNTMYAHLSTIDVSKGQTVGTGQTIGLSGMTGYATGPHLHFGVYATEGTKIMTLRQDRGSKKGCADAMMPVATLTAYLNPLSYL